MIIKKVNFSQAVGVELAHDVTEIRPNEFKGAAFRKGHVIRECDCSHFRRLGKNHFYELTVEENEYHENVAAEKLAAALAGDYVSWFEPPYEGKVVLRSKIDGLLKVDVEALTAFNLIPEVMCATRHNYTPVRKGEMVAATRAIPLVIKKPIIDQACDLVKEAGGVVHVLKLRHAKVGLVITGNEIYDGVISDHFEIILREKVALLGSEVIHVSFSPDDKGTIASQVQEALERGADLILTTGGMSVDPDDITLEAVKEAGAENIIYGSSVLPGAMFMIATIKGVPLLGIPACGIYHRITILDLVLPRILAGEDVSKKELAVLGHGGLCMNCSKCVYPNCAFGKF